MYLRARKKAAMYLPTLKMKNLQGGVTVGLLLSFLFYGILLQRCGDIELNPGPGPTRTNNLRQTRLASATGSTTAASTSSQPETTVEEPTLKDVMSMLHNMNSKFDEVKEDVRQMKDMYAGLQEEVSSLRQEVVDLKHENESLQEVNGCLSGKVEALERKTDDLEGRSKRNNVIIHGLIRHDKETREDCEELVREMITDKLEFAEDVQFDRLHRINGRPDSPIIGRCTFYKDKERLLRARRKLQGSQVFIGEDFSLRVREIRKKLVPHLKTAKKESKKVSMVYDHLVIEGKKYCLGEDDDLKEMT